ncbi:hypothetical protein LOZ80_24920 [Paenibacillus sp. HWE-109]|uniref:hypothetical protein n=1 Tax=Paenibacillus sp. HWE-109 TaxID=1306526 RepID=UPI001EE0D77D|nr:hypothetical protein [Paenibacillus sp. HWE-109]UKS24835.1 hypothetical protein LOZ80_24920 [Paenibacillus sp. HWE-109]
MILGSTLSADTVSVELTVKEAQALSAGLKFPADPQISKEARRKVKRSLDQKLFKSSSNTIAYHLLDV